MATAGGASAYDAKKERRRQVAKKELTQQAAKGDKKMRTRDLIYAGAFGAIYLVVMLILVMGSGMVPILYLVAPLTVGVVCGTIYEMCVLKVHKFGAALILGVLFALVSCTSNMYSLIAAIVVAILAELVIKAGGYKSKKMYLASFVVFNLNMACPYLMLQLFRDQFIQRAVDWYGQAYADGLAAIAPSWVIVISIICAILGGIIGSAIASKLISKHFSKAGIV